MAYILDDKPVTKGAKSPLALASFDRLCDVFKLARQGDPQSRRMWNDYAASDEAGYAGLVKTYVALEDDDRVDAQAETDELLVKAEKRAGGQEVRHKFGKRDRKLIKAAMAGRPPAPSVTKGARAPVLAPPVPDRPVDPLVASLRHTVLVDRSATPEDIQGATAALARMGMPLYG